MKGVILAGGLGTRLYPLTKVTNKHLLHVWDKPMIYYPIQTLVDAGIDEICLVVGGPFAGQFIHLLGNGEAFGLKKLHYVFQEGEGGIAAALKLAEPFFNTFDGDEVIVILGDNIFSDGIDNLVADFQKQSPSVTQTARILLSKVPDPCRFGNPEFDSSGKLLHIVEKPKEALSQYAVTGAYCYDNSVFNIINTLKPSNRGELEITDVNNYYLRNNALEYSFIDGSWTDAGTFESLYIASVLMRGE